MSPLFQRLALTGMVVWTISAAAPVIPLSIMSMTGVSARKLPYSDQPKGTLYFNVGGKPQALIAYWQGAGKYDPPRQCPELILRYAAKLGFSGFLSKAGAGDTPGSWSRLGTGSLAAAAFVQVSDARFSWVADGSTELPKPGSVISFAGWPTVPDGHVAIVGPYSVPSTGAAAVSIPLLEQNVSITFWETANFAKSKGVWHATLDGHSERKAIGWASPK